MRVMECRPAKQGQGRGPTSLIGRLLKFLAAVALAAAGLCGASAQSLPAPHGSLPASGGTAAKRKMISLVALSNEYVDLTADTLSKKLDELYPGKFWPPRQQANFVIIGPGPGQFLIKSTIPSAAGMFMVLSVPEPYTQFSDFARFVADPALRRIAEAQHCWLSVDLVREIASEADAYRFIGAALAKLAPAQAVLVVNPDNNSAIPFDNDLRRRMATGQFVP
jgi:hypothetical protein